MSVSNFAPSYFQDCNGIQQAIYKMRVFRLKSRLWSFSQAFYRGMRTRLRKPRTVHIAIR